VKVSKISSAHFHISLVQDLVLGYAKETNVYNFVVLHLKMVILSGFEQEKPSGL